jgi:ABC-type dipeptide/oligopeptide/nickel transport system permease subunit
VSTQAAEWVDLSVARRGPWRQAAARFRRRPVGMTALGIFAAFCLVGALAGVLAPYTAGQTFLQYIQKPQPPLTAHHLLGTDVLGRDFLTQLIFAIRETILSGLACAAGSTVVGVVVGALAGYYGGWLDALVRWVSSVVVAVPAMVVLVFILVWEFPITPVGKGLWLTAVLWPGVARVVRASVLTQRTRGYVEAAHAAGASAPRVLARHLLPNATGSIVVAATSLVGQAIVIVATVNYLGYGFDQAQQPTLGGLVADATRATSLLLAGPVPLSEIWWLYTFPAAVLVLLLLSVTFLGDALDEALNPRT